MSATPLVGNTFFGIDISQLGDQLLSIRRRISKRVLLLDFSQGALTLAEASLSQAGVQLNHLSRLDLPEEALDRGVPAEPAKMAALIQAFCTEKKIPAHRAAVVLPPDVAFQRLIELPSDLTTDQAREYVIDPANGLQIPFPLIQTDFDLCPVLTPTTTQIAAGMRLYMLSAVPQMMVDRVVEMMQLAELELQILELGHHTLLRALCLDLVLLSELEVDLVLELLSDASHLILVTSSGLLGSERLAPIREFPAPALDEEQLKAVLEEGKSAEAYVVEDDNYLPLSDLDLRVLIADLKAALRRFYQQYPGARVRCLRLSGLNSSHPGLVELLHDALGVHVDLHRPLLVHGVAGFSSSDCLLQASLGRLVGLGLGLLPAEQLSTCPVDAMRSEKRPETEKATALVDLLDQPQMKSDLDLIPVVASGSARDDADRLVSEQTKEVDVVSELSADNDSSSREITDVEDDAILRDVLDELDDSHQWPSIVGGVEVVEEEELKGEVMDETEWPSIVGGVEVVEEEELKGEVMDETEWPSIVGGVEVVEEEELKGEVMDETEWPSIVGGVEVVEEEELKGEVMDETEWPSIVGGVEVVEEEELKGEVMDETEWPSIVGGVEVVEEEELKGEVMDETEWPSIVGGVEVVEEEELKGEVMDETEWPSIVGGVEVVEEEELKGEGMDETEWPSTPSVALDDPERFTDQVDDPLDSNDVGLLLEGLDLGDSQNSEIIVPVSSQEKNITDQAPIPNDESEGLGELRFADSD